MKKALITGITGQDGSYLAELLLAKGYEVHGIIRRASSFNTDRIDHLYKDRHESGVKMFLHYGDLTDSSNLNRLIEKIQPTEIYNLAAQSHVQVSFEVRTVKGERQTKKANFDQFEIICDEGKNIGGDNSAPPPLAYFAASIAF